MARKRVRTNIHVAKEPSKQGTFPEHNETCSITRNECLCTKERKLHKQTLCSHVSCGDNITSADDRKTDDRIFPRWIRWMIFPITLTIRLIYVLEPKNWWILHPDEIFQTIEVAHSDAYGYGFRPYEYLEPPTHETNENMTLCEARLQEIRLGMYSLRSFILPKLLSIVMVAADVCGMNWSPFLVIKTFHAVLTSTLPLAVFHLTRSLHSSRDVAVLSAILVSFSLSLNIFGTHTIINSFLSPLVILSLLAFVRIVKEGNSRTVTHKQYQKQRDTSIHLPNFVLLIISSLKQIWCIEKTLVQHKCDSEKSLSRETLSTNGQNLENSNKTRGGEDENANIVHSASHCSHDYKPTCQRDEVIQSKTVESTFGITHTDVWTVLPLCSDGTIHLNEYMSGLLLAVCIYIRVDLVLVPLLLFFTDWNYTYRHLVNVFDQLKSYLLGMVCGVMIGGSFDYITYGFMFISPLQWFKFNVWNDSAGGIFGENSHHYYIAKLYGNEPLFILLSFIILGEYVVSCYVCKRKFGSADSRTLVGASNQSLFIFICLLIAYSTNSHKELRFLHNSIIFFYIAASRAIISLYSTLTRIWFNQNGNQYSIYCVYLFILLFVSSHINLLFKMTHTDRARWTYGGNSDSHGDNVCLDFIRNQNDVTGVFLDSSIKMAGAYSVLHKRVPIFALNMYEFMEYNYRGSFDVTGRYKGIHTNGFTDFSDTSEFISIYNTPYLLKQLIDKPEYNYLVLKTDRQFVDVGYKEVFRAGNSKVLKRKFETNSEVSLAEISSDVMIGSNATVLEYEGSWLKHFGLYAKAEQRLIHANRLDRYRIGPFRILLDMYKTLSRADSYKRVLSACLQVHTSESCLRHSEPVLLHANYFRTL